MKQLFLRLFSPSVDNVIKCFDQMISSLDRVAAYHLAKAGTKRYKIGELQMEVNQHDNESARANIVKQKIKDLIK